MSTNEKTDEIIESDTDVTAGPWFTFAGNDAYDLALVKEASGRYVLQLSMKLQFFFEDDGANRWNRTEKEQFVRDWERVVRNVWDNLGLLPLENSFVHLKLKFETQIEGWMQDHWEIYVTKMPTYPANTSDPSFDNPGTIPQKGNVYLSFDNVQLRAKKGCPTHLNQYKQVLAAHEFGHMLGITLDEYYGSDCESGQKNAYSGDYDSILHIGQQVRDRHKIHMVTWLSEALKKHGVK